MISCKINNFCACYCQKGFVSIGAFLSGRIVTPDRSRTSPMG